MTARRDFLAGVRTISPALLGLAPFGVICGVSAVEAGLSSAQSMGLSLFFFAGTAQLAVINLLTQEAAWPVVLLAVVVINSRLVVYSASVAPILADESISWRAVISYLMVDHLYAIALQVHEANRSIALRWYLLGIGLTMWVVWVITTAVGIMVGTTAPPGWGLDLVVPLTFSALAAPHVQDRRHVVAALVAAMVAVAGAGLPMNLGLPLATLMGVGVGMGLDEVAS